jgi:hypothetical protein
MLLVNYFLTLEYPINPFLWEMLVFLVPTVSSLLSHLQGLEMKLKFFLGLAAFTSALMMLPQGAVAGEGYIVNHANGKCLDFAAGNFTNSVTLQQWSCGGKYAYHQRWRFLGLGIGIYPNQASSYVFQNVRNGTCAAVENDSLANAARIVQRPCDLSNPSQHWIQLTRDVLGVKTKWMNGRSAKCLDIWNNNNGTVFQQYDCAKASYWPQQMFVIDAVPRGEEAPY